MRHLEGTEPMQVGHLRLKTDARLHESIRWIAWLELGGRPVFGKGPTPSAAVAGAYAAAARWFDVRAAAAERAAAAAQVVAEQPAGREVAA